MAADSSAIAPAGQLKYKPGAKGWHQAINILLINIQLSVCIMIEIQI
ncbi:MAG: hypothetical protein GQF41_1430 [Candidatus Rifleibacterium amylolyticum]|nr:MAG: hypothetical protein GQF41_1430 [Candidatus Rifleibacterium amylolyticum]